ncbi:MAG: ADP-forming succinate--CoA ligase subunit beta [Saccharofermentanales bacterium]
MDILEYQARDLFNKYGIPTMKACVIKQQDEVSDKIKEANLCYPLVAKVQIPMGKRGKAGGIRFAENISQLQDHVADLLHKELLGFQVNEIMVVEKAEYEQEYYLSILLDRLSKKPVVIFSAEGGMDIEELAASQPDKIIKVEIDPLIGLQEFHITHIISRSGLPLSIKKNLFDVISKLYQCFTGSDCLLAEINPLVMDESGNLIALDGKVRIDDSALYRLPELAEIREHLHEEPLVRAARHHNFLYIPIEQGGQVAVMSNGSGMLMSCIDLLTQAGLTVGAALDLGGGATAERIKEGLLILFSTEGINSVLINIFGGITRCDEVAQGIVYAWESFKGIDNIAVLMEGTNRDLGLGILAKLKDNIILPKNLPQGVEVLAQRMMDE